MLDHRSYPVDPYVLCYKLQNVVSGTFYKSENNILKASFANGKV